MTGRTKRPRIAVETRWMVRHDLPQVLAIEESSFDQRWSDCDFRRIMRGRDTIGIVAELPPAETGDCRPVVGFVVYRLDAGAVELLNLAVDWRFRRGGIGRFLVNRIIDKLSPRRRKVLGAVIRERNLLAQCFYRSLGFQAVEVLRGRYDDTGEDGYRFEFRAKE